MEPYSVGLLICGVTVALYQMSGTPFVLNIIIFCLILLLSLYTMYISGYRLPSDVLFYWIYPEDTAQDKEGEKAPTDYHDDQITKKLRQLTGHIVRDFILSWYNAITDDVTFVQEAFELFEHLLTDARAKVTQIEKERLLSNVLSEFIKHIETYKNAVKQVDTKGIGSGKDEDKRRDQLIAIAYCSENPHPALASLPDSDMEYLRGVVALVLKALLPDDYRLNETPLYIIRELIAQNVLKSVVNLMSDPLWIYNTLVKILDESELGTTNTTDSVEGGDSVCTMGISSPVAGETDYGSGVVAEDNGRAETINHDDECVASPEDNICLSHSSSVTSRLSVDSQDLCEMTIANSEDIPLPVMFSEMHFAPDCNRVDLDTATVRRRLLSTVVERAPQERLFHRIRITEYTIMKENFDSAKKYALYKITFKTRERLPIQSSTPINIPAEENASSFQINPRSTEPQEEITTKRHQVQRRFREFLVLQERLSQNLVAKKLIGDINGPSRMFPVPFGNMDKDYIEQRRKFLQAYLRHIFAIPFISKTKEVKEFLAHEMDPRIAYVKKPEPMPRFDKLFKSAIQDLLGHTMTKFSSGASLSYKEADQAFQSEQHRAEKATHVLSNSLVPGEVSNIGAVTKFKNKVFGVSKHHALEKTPTVKANRLFGSFEGQRSFSSKWKDEVGVIAKDSTQNHTTRLEARGLGDGCDAVNMTTTHDIETEVLPANLILQLVLKVWDLPPGKHGLTSIVLTKYIQAYLSEKLCALTTKQSCTKYLELLHDALWPGGQWESSGSVRPTWVTASDEVKSKAVIHAEICLKKALPNALVYLMSEEDYNSGIKLITESLQNSNINKHLIYSLFDLVIFEVFPQVSQ